MRYALMLISFLAGSLSNVISVRAHFGLADGDDVGTGLFWVWGAFIVGVAGFILYRRSLAKLPPEGRELKRRLNELERALTSCHSQLRNADDYPTECGLSDQQRRARLDSVLSIQGMIAKTKSELAAI